MVKPKSEIQNPKLPEYRCRVNLNIYDSPSCTKMATQAAASRHLRLLSPTAVDNAYSVCLCEDAYPGWLRVEDLSGMEQATTPYRASAVSVAEIKQRLPAVIAFCHDAMKQPNYYLWGGTVEPNYDCSGLMQAAFASIGIWLPRDSYQQEAFTQSIAFEELLSGDLVFFGTPAQVNHVGLYVGEGYYIHSSGKDMGRNGIGIDRLSEHGDDISRSYYQRLRSCGRVVRSFDPSDKYITNYQSQITNHQSQI